MKILMVNRVLYPRSLNETVMLRLADALTALGDYRDSVEQLSAARASLAKSLEAAGNLSGALALYELLDQAEDSQQG